MNESNMEQTNSSQAEYKEAVMEFAKLVSEGVTGADLSAAMINLSAIEQAKENGIEPPNPEYTPYIKRPNSEEGAQNPTPQEPNKPKTRMGRPSGSIAPSKEAAAEAAKILFERSTHDELNDEHGVPLVRESSKNSRTPNYRIITSMIMSNELNIEDAPKPVNNKQRHIAKLAIKALTELPDDVKNSEWQNKFFALQSKLLS